MRYAAVLTAALWAAGLCTPAHAQLTGAADVGFETQHFWRGVTRVSKPTVQPALSLAWIAPKLLISAGGWTLLEPWEPGSNGITMAGADELVGAVDTWVQASYRWRIFSATIDLTGGATVHMYPNAANLRANDLPDGAEITAAVRLTGLDQLYTFLGLPADLPIGIETMAAVDLSRVGGWYLEAGLRSDLPVFFVGEPIGALIIRWMTGFSWNQESGAQRPGYYQGSGATHTALSVSATPYFELGSIPLTVNLTLYGQVGFDEATQVLGKTRGSLETTVSILLPARRLP